MTTESAPPAQQQAAKDGASASSQSLSQLLARILDQLSLSAWLPAGIVTALMALAVMIRLDPNGGLRAAHDALSDASWVQLFGYIGLVVMLTTITQAFEFEAIRMVEGYWPANWLSNLATRIGCWRQLQRWERAVMNADLAHRNAVVAGLDCVRALALTQAASDAPDANEMAKAVTELSRQLETSTVVPGGLSNEATKAVARSLDFAPAHLLRELERWEMKQENFPERGRLLPTTLGNTLRAGEDAAFPDAEQLERQVQKVYPQLPRSLQLEHNAWRNRLSLYSTLTFSIILLSPIAWALVATGPNAVRNVVIGVAVSAATSLTFYRAAIASARAYGLVLETISETTGYVSPLAQSGEDLREIEGSSAVEVGKSG